LYTHIVLPIVCVLPLLGLLGKFAILYYFLL
jgi:hypothetical protein